MHTRIRDMFKDVLFTVKESVDTMSQITEALVTAGKG